MQPYAKQAMHASKLPPHAEKKRPLKRRAPYRTLARLGTVPRSNGPMIPPPDKEFSVNRNKPKIQRLQAAREGGTQNRKTKGNYQQQRQQKLKDLARA